jgi:hypothetical protein
MTNEFEPVYVIKPLLYSVLHQDDRSTGTLKGPEILYEQSIQSIW